MDRNGEQIEKFLKEVQERVDPAMEGMISRHSGERFKEEVNYFVKMGGKRLRPALVFLSADVLGGGKENDCLHSAAAVEILHNYTLLVDDIIDNSETRRGNPTVWKKWGAVATECLGMHYIASVFRVAAYVSLPSQVSDVLAETLQVIADGEMIDILQERVQRNDEPFIKDHRYKEVSENDALEMMSKKTAELLKNSCHIGGLCAEGGEEQLERLKEYGYYLGMAFQIQDDTLDIFGEEKKFGKKIGKDIEERKGGNMIILFASQETGGELEEIMAKDSIANEDIKRAIEIIKRTKARERAERLGKHYAEKAKDSLDKLPENEQRDMMHNMIEYLLKREK